MGDVVVALVQMTSGTDATRNVERAVARIREAASRGATYVQLPEYFNFLGPTNRYRESGESIPGATTKTLCDLAKELGVTVHVGSMLELSPDPQKCFNTSVVIGPSGEIIAKYRKIHLFDIDVPGRVQSKESDAITPGSSLVVADCPSFALGMSVCFDLRFPEMYREMSARGASVLAVPSAFNATTGKAHWDVLIRARAIENLAFVLAAAQVGTTDEGISTHGHSMIVSPWGEVIAASTSDDEDLLVAPITVGDVTRRRSQLKVVGAAIGSDPR